MSPPLPRLFGSDPRTRARVQMSSITFLAYFVSVTVMGWGVEVDVIGHDDWVRWTVATTAGCMLIAIVSRHPAGLRLHDATITEIQMLWAYVMINWAYIICGQWRTSALFPLLMVSTFGAMNLGWRRQMLMTMIGTSTLACSIAIVHHEAFDLPHQEMTKDLANLTLVAIFSTCSAMLSVRLGMVRRHLKEQRTELQTAIAEIRAMATRDALTGLANRRQILAQIEDERHRVMQGRDPFTLALIDIDHFKRINDQYGHGLGDRVLCEFARCAVSSVRSIDTVARWGGEEFLVLSPAAGHASPMALLERIRCRLRSLSFDGLPPGLRITVSIGVATAIPGETATRQIERADRALYRAKHRGRDRIEIAPDELVAMA